MQQQVQINQSAEQVLNDAAAFFAKRRAKISDRSDQGFQFGLPGSEEGERGHVTVAKAPGAGSTVTVQADGLGVLAIAEGYVRELRKQAKDAGRQSRGGTTLSGGGLHDLRQRLGMPEPAAQQRRPPQATPEAAAAAADVERRGLANPTGGVRGDVAEGVADAPGAHEPIIPAAGGGPGDVSAGATQPDGPAPVEAPVVSPETGPQSAPPGEAAVGPHPSSTGPAEKGGSQPQSAPPVNEATALASASAEDQGGVPDPQQVQVDGEPAHQAPGATAGASGGSLEQGSLGDEASTSAPAEQGRDKH